MTPLTKGPECFINECQDSSSFSFWQSPEGKSATEAKSGFRKNVYENILVGETH